MRTSRSLEGSALVCVSQIDILASLVHPRGRRGNKFAVIESYIDESGIHGGAKICVVAGYFGTQSAWAKFEREWKKVLHAYSIQHFHANEFWARCKGMRVKPYANWDDEKADKFIDSLAQVITRSRIFAFGHAVIGKHWDALSLDDRKWLTGEKYKNGKFRSSGSPNKSYYLPFLFCVIDSSRYSGAADKIHFFVGLDRTFAKYAVVLYRSIMQDNRIEQRNLLGNIDFPLSKDTPQLQAADLLVYQLYKHNLARFEGTATKTKVLKLLLRNRKPQQSFRVFDANELAELVRLSSVAELRTNPHATP